MEIGRHIRELRGAAGMSQDDLAARIYVSRQTISSWENDKTYPDLQSILLISEIFGVSTDDLIKGDVETMTKALDHDTKLLMRLGATMLVFLVLFIAAAVWCIVQLVAWGWPVAQVLPTGMLALVLWGITMFAAAWADRLKRDHDLATYQEISDFIDGKPVDRAAERSRRERLMPYWMRTVRTAGLMLIAAAAAWGACWLIEQVARMMGA